jgi:primosomal protein N' (replication factor Y)
VTLVGVVAADAGLAFPDFRAAERTFQLLAQVAGRAGRGARPGRVLIQTRNPEHPCLAAAAHHDHAAFCAHDLELRRVMGYPPCGHAAAVRVDGTRADEVERVVREVAATLERAIGARADVVLRGPAPSPLVRLRGRTRWSLLLTAARREPLRRVLDALDDEAPNVTGDLRWHVDVDPQDFL